MTQDRDDNEVGYRNPPKATQFKKGQSGNPRGRPKGSRNFTTYVDAVLDAQMTVTEHGQTKRVSTVEALLLLLRDKALMKNDQRAMECLLGFARQRSAEIEGQSAERKLTDADEGILERFGQDFLARTQQADDTPAPEEAEDGK